MREQEFRNVMDTCREKSGNDLQAYLERFGGFPYIVSLLTGTEFDDLGLARTSTRNVAQRVFDFDDSGGSLTESLEQFDSTNADGVSISQLYQDLEMLDTKSGGDQKDFLEEMFEDYAYPSVVSFAVLHDQSLGFGESTMSKAVGVKDSLPFYESVVDILRVDGDPLTGPQAGKPFKPMKAVPESRGEPDNAVVQRKLDGYRCLIHVGSEQTVRAFSRSMNEITESLPELQEMGLAEMGGHYIIDCEVIAETGSYSSTSERIGRSAENVERDVEMEFAAFDVPLFRGVDMSDMSLRKRHSRLKTITEFLDDDRFYHLDLKYDLLEAKNEAIEAGDEGIIVKDIEGPYKFDKRSAYWQKQKFDASTVDVRICGFEEGEGKASNTLGKVELETADGVYIGNSGSGFTDEQRDKIWNNKDDWFGRTIEVEARGLGTHNKLRMPIFKRDRADDGEPDSFNRINELMHDV